MLESVTLDELDRKVLQALQLDGRASFRRIGQVLDVSENTAARRYRNLRALGLRTVARPVPARLGRTEWIVRIQVTPDAATPVAEALAKRPETGYVSVGGAGTEIHCGITAPATEENDAPLLPSLHRMNRVTAINAHCLLHVYEGDPPVWATKRNPLAPEQHAALAPPAPHTVEPDAELADLDDADHALIAALGEDARATYPQLAAATGLTNSTAKRRVDRLVAEGVVLICTEFPPSRLGYRLMSYLWLRVDPARLEEVGTSLAAHTPISFAAAVTGPHNMVATAITRNTGGLYRYLAEHVGTLPGVQYVETAPALRQIKRLTR
ncbi:Lrp/AsnC family transcriptional regulator [Streptomyces sp. NPDC046862]|uniref:Lrp/AsnC family transcriptional regulator n=1 Tax=Streptomyces sp. NPDC046862 TaxID=3154603 RepID=UPI0034544345